MYICRECVGNAGVARYKKGDSIEFNYAQKGKWYPGTVTGAQLGKLGWGFSCKGMEVGGTTWEVRDIEGDDLRRPREGGGYGASSKRKTQGNDATEGSRGGRGSESSRGGCGSDGGGSGRAHSWPPTTKANRQERSVILLAAGWTVRVLSSATYQYTSFDGKFKYRSCDKAWNHHMEAQEAQGKGPGGNASGRRGSGSGVGAARGGRGSRGGRGGGWGGGRGGNAGGKNDQKRPAVSSSSSGGDQEEGEEEKDAGADNAAKRHRAEGSGRGKAGASGKSKVCSRGCGGAPHKGGCAGRRSQLNSSVRAKARAVCAGTGGEGRSKKRGKNTVRKRKRKSGSFSAANNPRSGGARGGSAN